MKKYKLRDKEISNESHYKIDVDKTKESLRESAIKIDHYKINVTSNNIDSEWKICENILESEIDDSIVENIKDEFLRLPFRTKIKLLIQLNLIKFKKYKRGCVNGTSI